jgi:hypothetical protein
MLINLLFINDFRYGTRPESRKQPDQGALLDENPEERLLLPVDELKQLCYRDQASQSEEGKPGCFDSPCP